MIPEIISNHLASLQPDKRRFSKTVEIELLDDLTITHTQVHNAVIQSDMRLNYDQVDQYLSSPNLFENKWDKEVCELAQSHAPYRDVNEKTETQKRITIYGTS